MVNDDAQFSAAKRAYRRAAEEGNRQEEARWANVIGNILKNRGEYVNSLEWFRKDYDLSIKYLPEKHLLPTCQSLGEIYLRRHDFEQALIYQRKHLELAQDANDLIEQQRASTQLGRTYHEIFLKSEADPYAIKNAKKYFKSAMELAQKLVRNSPSNKSNFIKEYIDAHNNIGMLEMDLDNLEEAQKILTIGLKICDEEEVIENDDGRTRLHHNLGNVYMELRKWDKARIHIEKDISICRNISHLQGEAKGYINLGELHYRSQRYEEAIKCYLMALDLSNRLEGENALTIQIKQNIETVEQASKVNEELKIEEQNLKKIVRKMTAVRGTSSERKCLLQQSSCLDRLIEKSSMISSWVRHRLFAKEKKKVAEEICNKEKIGDSYLCIGESYQKLRNFKKAQKWYNKSWKVYNSIGNLEGQALAKINIGDVLDCDGDCEAALNAFKEGYRIAVTANLPSVQLAALENMHYSYMVRFDNVEEARKLQSQIEKLKKSNTKVVEQQIMSEECCSESEREEDVCSPELNKSDSVDFSPDLNDDDDTPLISLLNSSKKSLKTKAAKSPFISIKSPEHSTTSSHSVGHKRARVILSDNDDDEDENNRVHRARVDSCPKEDVATSDVCVKNCGDLCTGAQSSQHVSPVNLEESTCSYKSSSSKVAAQDSKDRRFSRTNEDIHTLDFCANGSKTDTCASENSLHACYDEPCQHVIFKIEKDYVHIDPSTCLAGDMINIESMKLEVACLYYLRLSLEKRSRGLLPVIKNIKCGERVLQSLECIDILKDFSKEKGCIELSIDVWVPKRLLKLYIDSCKELSESPNIKLLKRLYKLEVSEDEITVSDCELQDISIAPLFNALHLHKTVALLDLSHNLLGNQTMEKLQQVFTSSSQKYGGLDLDLHCNRLGPSALFQICECPVLYSRLEVLNISQNRLTDACSSYLSTILQNCKGLYSLNIEQCSITSRTIQKIADSLDSGSALTQICIGHNHPISGNALVNLMTRLATLKRFSELNLNGLKLSRPVLDSICHLAKTSCLSELMLGNTNIRMDGALHLMDSLSNESQELVKLDLSYCGLTCDFVFRLNTKILFFNSILELNLGENPIMHEGGNALAKLLTNPGCSLRVLLLSKCQLGLTAILQIIQSLSNNTSLEELNLSENTSSNHNTLKSMETLTNAEGAQLDLCSVNTEYNLQVPDSDDDERVSVKTKSDDSCTISSNLNCSIKDRQFAQYFSSAIADATQLQLLDLSKNGFSEEDLTMFYASWSSGCRDGVAKKHVSKEIAHFSVEANSCCNVKPCCRKI